MLMVVGMVGSDPIQSMYHGIMCRSGQMNIIEGDLCMAHEY